MNKIIAVQDSKGNIYTIPSDSPKCILSRFKAKSSERSSMLTEAISNA